MRALLAAGLLLTAACLPSPLQAAAGHSAWAEFVGDQDACLERGARVVASLGFRATITNDRQAVYGWRAVDLIGMRCIADRGLVVFFIYNAGVDDGMRLIQQLQAGMSGAPAAGGGGGSFK